MRRYKEGEICPKTGRWKDVTCPSYSINMVAGKRFPPSNCGDRDATWEFVR